MIWLGLADQIEPVVSTVIMSGFEMFLVVVDG